MLNTFIAIIIISLFFISNTYSKLNVSKHPFLKYCLADKRKETVNLILLIKKNLKTRTCRDTLNKLQARKELFVYCGVACNLEPLYSITSLTSLEIINGKIENVNYIKNMKKLKKLNLYNNKIKNISELSNLKYIEWLNLNDNNIEHVKTIGTLKSLTTLDLANNNIIEISKLKTLNKLRHLDLSGNKIQDISPLKNLKGISELKLSSNPIIKSLAKCPYGKGVARAVDQFCREYLNIH